MPQIETERLLLRPVTLRDVDELQRLVYGDADAAKYLPSGKPWPISETRALVAWWVSHWQSRNFGPWAVIDKASGEFLGDCGLMYMISAGHVVELMYALGKESWGRGLATEAARAAVRHGFEASGLKRIVAVAEPENAGSRRVMEKIGMTFEGINAKYYGADLAVYSIVKAGFVAGDGHYVVEE